MKKFIYIFMCACIAVSSFTACGKKEEASVAASSEQASSSEEITVSADDPQSRAVGIKDIGLFYITPAQWAEYQSTNIYPQTIQTDGTLARVIYNYISTEDAQKLSAEGEGSESINDYLTPICEITVAKSSNFSGQKLKYIKEAYNHSTEVSKQNDYKYVLFYQSADYESRLQGDDLEIYKKLASKENIDELTDSLFTTDFDPDDVKSLAESMGLNDYITFETTTLEGDKITSQCFGKYLVTLVNFWGTYAIDRSNEQADLQAVYKEFGNGKKGVNVMNIVIDTPSEEAEKTVKELKEKAGGKFTTLIMDETLANWAQTNLEGVPTTVLVDSTGKIVSDQIKGAKGADFYIDVINEYLDNAQ